MIDQHDLFSKVRLGRYELSHRVAMAPMTRNRAAAGGMPTATMTLYYRRRAGAALVFTEAAQVSPQGKGDAGTPGICTKNQVVGWRRVTSAMHAERGRILLQLWHAGRVSHVSFQPDRDAPRRTRACFFHVVEPAAAGDRPMTTALRRRRSAMRSAASTSPMEVTTGNVPSKPWLAAPPTSSLSANRTSPTRTWPNACASTPS